jgi:hypothetical protein
MAMMKTTILKSSIVLQSTEIGDLEKISLNNSVKTLVVGRFEINQKKFKLILL